MIRKHENSVSWKAGALAIAVHAVLLGALLVSFNWKSAHSVAKVTEVDLWDKLPTPPTPEVKVEPKPEVKPEPVVKEEPKPDPKAEEKAKEEAEAEIALEKKKQELAEKERQMAEKERLQEEKRKKDEAKKKLLASMRDEDLNKADKKEKSDAFKKVQQEALSDDKAQNDRQAAAANASLIGEYTAKIKAKIRGNVNKTLCGEGNPELHFEIGLLPTGQLAGSPKITKSSGTPACDDAVERAIIASEPLPLPSDSGLFSSFRNLNLKFRPND